MEIIKIKDTMNDCILLSQKYNVTKEGFSISNASTGIYCFYRKEGDNCLSSIPSDNVIYPKVGFFQRHRHKDFVIEIFSVNGRVFHCQGITAKMHFDATQSYRSVDLPAPYDIYFKVNSNDVFSFISFAKTYFFNNPISYEEVFEYLTPIINSHIKKCIGASEIFVVEDLETEMEEVERNVVKSLNESSEFKTKGILIESIKIDIKDDFMIRKEKKLIQGNRELLKK